MSHKSSQTAMLSLLRAMNEKTPVGMEALQARSGMHSNSIYVNLRAIMAEGLAKRHQKSRNLPSTYTLTKAGSDWIAINSVDQETRERRSTNAALDLARCLGYPL